MGDQHWALSIALVHRKIQVTAVGFAHAQPCSAAIRISGLAQSKFPDRAWSGH